VCKKKRNLHSHARLSRTAHIIKPPSTSSTNAPVLSQITKNMPPRHAGRARIAAISLMVATALLLLLATPTTAALPASSSVRVLAVPLVAARSHLFVMWAVVEELAARGNEVAVSEDRRQ